MKTKDELYTIFTRVFPTDSVGTCNQEPLKLLITQLKKTTQFDIAYWAENRDTGLLHGTELQALIGTEELPCGTTACIAGHAALQKAYPKDDEISSDGFARFLGIPKMLAISICHPTGALYIDEGEDECENFDDITNEEAAWVMSNLLAYVQESLDTQIIQEQVNS